MENIFYSLTAHPSCIEGVKILKQDNNHFELLQEYGLPDMKNSVMTIPLAAFLEANQWHEYHVTLIIPMEKVTCRVLTMPFHDKRKIKQVIPFEIENEILGDPSEMHYTYSIQPMPDGSSRVLLLLVERAYLDALQMLFNEWEIALKNVDCAAYILYKTLLNPPQNAVFQLYLGGDEVFINYIHESQLRGVKIFATRISDFLSEYWNFSSMDLAVFLQRFARHTGNEQTDDKTLLKELQLFKAIKKELQWLCSQFNLFLRTHHFIGECQIFLYGMFGPFIEWNNSEFRMKTFPLEEVRADEPLLTSPLPESTIVQNEKETKPAQEPEKTEKAEHLPTPPPTVISGDAYETALMTSNRQSIALGLERTQWGILGDLCQYGMNYLEGGNLSFFSEGAPLTRFIRKYRPMVILGSCLLVLLLGITISNYVIKLNLLKQEISRMDDQIKAQIRYFLPDAESSSVKSMMTSLEEQIARKKQEIEVSKKFAKRDYFHMQFLNSLSTLVGSDVPFQIDRLEMTHDRFAITGNINSYDNLQLMKNALAKIESFKEKKLVESNRKSPEGINFRITME
ncbi:MAG: hypothetical protein HQM11_03255 [SAR324 cluster bacterium]|nr:hypothetical protein [SAR324 cluster bacterium]